MRGRHLVLTVVVVAALAPVLLASCGDDTNSDSSGNAAVRDAIDDAGVDPSSALLYEHFFYFDDETSARGAESDLVEAGFDVETSPPEDGVADWSLLATQEATLDAAQLDALTTEMEALASLHGGTYDGWGTALD